MQQLKNWQHTSDKGKAESEPHEEPTRPMQQLKICQHTSDKGKAESEPHEEPTRTNQNGDHGTIRENVQIHVHQ